jgi:hypothetical protein
VLREFTATVPLVGFVPLHPPDALQLVAPALLHCRVVVSPCATRPGVEAMLTVGGTAVAPDEAVPAFGVVLVSPKHAARAVTDAASSSQREARTMRLAIPPADRGASAASCGSVELMRPLLRFRKSINTSP